MLLHKSTLKHLFGKYDYMIMVISYKRGIVTDLIIKKVQKKVLPQLKPTVKTKLK